MSLINDALKRASQSDKDRPAREPLPRPMQPVAAQRRTQISWLLAAAVIAVLGLSLAGWFFWKWWAVSHPIIVAAPVQPVRIVQTVAVEPSPPPAPKPLPIVHESPPPVAAAPAPLAPVVAPIPAPVAKPSWPIALTVKAIFYSRTSPRALVNGRTVEPGDQIEGVLITKIEPDRVWVSWNGETKELLMGAK